MPTLSPPCVLSIAGTDPSGGAGIQADIKAISATGSYAASVITALVAQNTQRVDAIAEISPQFFEQQLTAVFSDLDIHAIKIGMLHNQTIIQHLKPFLENYTGPVVIDPVMVAKNGALLLQPEIITDLKQTLFPLATLITPNIPEAETLLNIAITSYEKMEAAAKALAETYRVSVLLKGGHLETEQAADVLYSWQDQKVTRFETLKIITKNTHGTGCTLSSAIASYLAQGLNLIEAIQQAKNYLTQALVSGSRFTIGKGFGPVDHFYYLRENHHDIRNTSSRCNPLTL